MAAKKETEQEKTADSLWKSKDWTDTRKFLEEAKAKGTDKKIEKITF